MLPGVLDEEGQRLARHLVEHVAQANPRDGRPADGASAGTSASAGATGTTAHAAPEAAASASAAD